MDFEGKYNVKSPAVKRLMREACELKEPTEEYWAHPLDDNLFEWHFTVQGPPGTDFEGGVYHGRIILPADYPMRPPNIILMTPNGRFETNKKICLSISGYHPETWQPSWSIRTALLALIAFMPTPGGGTIGSLDYTPEERQMLARKSQLFECSSCGKAAEHLLSSASRPRTQQELSPAKQYILGNGQCCDKDSWKDKFQIHPQLEEAPHVEEVQQPSENEQVRQRVGVSQPVQPQVQHATVDTVSNTNRSYRSWLMWFLLAAIVFLICRRLFLK